MCYTGMCNGLTIHYYAIKRAYVHSTHLHGEVFCVCCQTVYGTLHRSVLHTKYTHTHAHTVITWAHNKMCWVSEIQTKIYITTIRAVLSKHNNPNHPLPATAAAAWAPLLRFRFSLQYIYNAAHDFRPSEHVYWRSQRQQQASNIPHDHHQNRLVALCVWCWWGTQHMRFHTEFPTILICLVCVYDIDTPLPSTVHIYHT